MRYDENMSYDVTFAPVISGCLVIFIILCPVDARRQAAVCRAVRVHHHEPIMYCYLCPVDAGRQAAVCRAVRVHHHEPIMYCYLCPVDAGRQAAVCRAVRVHHHEPTEHGERAVRPGGRRLHARPHLHTDQGQPTVSPLHGTIREQLLRQEAVRRGAVLVDATHVGDRVYQDHGLR